MCSQPFEQVDSRTNAERICLDGVRGSVTTVAIRSRRFFVQWREFHRRTIKFSVQAINMTQTHFKRYRMQFDLRRKLVEPPPVPADYQLLAWNPNLLDLHAKAKFASFSHEIDAVVFSCLADAKGCFQLMNDIVQRSNFAPQATWLIVRNSRANEPPQPCATVQGIFDPSQVGSIQNVGVAPAHRGLGLGSVLLHRALKGFQQADQRFATLEVTARNSGALRLYQRIGFEILRTVYRSVELVLE